MKKLAPLVVTLILSAFLFVGFAQLAGCASTPHDRLIHANDAATLVYKEIGHAHDAGILTDADLAKIKPARTAVDAALDEAGRLDRAGQADSIGAYLNEAMAGVDALNKALTEANSRKRGP